MVNRRPQCATASAKQCVVGAFCDKSADSWKSSLAVGPDATFNQGSDFILP